MDKTTFYILSNCYTFALATGFVLALPFYIRGGILAYLLSYFFGVVNVILYGDHVAKYYYVTRKEGGVINADNPGISR